MNPFLPFDFLSIQMFLKISILILFPLFRWLIRFLTSHQESYKAMVICKDAFLMLLDPIRPKDLIACESFLNLANRTQFNKASKGFVWLYRWNLFVKNRRAGLCTQEQKGVAHCLGQDAVPYQLSCNSQPHPIEPAHIQPFKSTLTNITTKTNLKNGIVYRMLWYHSLIMMAQ